MRFNRCFTHARVSILLPVLLFCTLPYSGTAHAQSGGTIPAGTTIDVRTIDDINLNNSDGRVFSPHKLGMQSDPEVDPSRVGSHAEISRLQNSPTWPSVQLPAEV